MWSKQDYPRSSPPAPIPTPRHGGSSKRRRQTCAKSEAKTRWNRDLFFVDPASPGHIACAWPAHTVSVSTWKPSIPTTSLEVDADLRAASGGRTWKLRRQSHTQSTALGDRRLPLSPSHASIAFSFSVTAKIKPPVHVCGYRRPFAIHSFQYTQKKQRHPQRVALPNPNLSYNNQVVGTDWMVFRMRPATRYGSAAEFGRRSSR